MKRRRGGEDWEQREEEERTGWIRGQIYKKCENVYWRKIWEQLAETDAVGRGAAQWHTDGDSCHSWVSSFWVEYGGWMCVDWRSVACFSYVGTHNVSACLLFFSRDPAFQLKAECRPLFGAPPKRETEKKRKRITLFRHSLRTKGKDSILSPSASHEGQTLFIGV